MYDSATSQFLFVGLPYVAIATLLVGTILRWRRDRFSWSALSSQVLESRLLAWGTVPFHAGLVVLLAGHVLPLLFPSTWQRLMGRPGWLATVETIGLAAALAAGAGLAVLIVRRSTTGRIRAVSTVMDAIVLGVLLVQVATGIDVATRHRWGSVWSTGTTTPYLWSLATLRPDASLVDGLPVLVRVHLSGAWILAIVFPFSRLVHMLSFPLGYLARPPQRVLWAARYRKAPEPERRTR